MTLEEEDFSDFSLKKKDKPFKAVGDMHHYYQAIVACNGPSYNAPRILVAVSDLPIPQGSLSGVSHFAIS